MTNYCQDPDQIRKAAESGLIDPADYQRYLKIENTLQVLKKGFDENELSAGVYSAAVNSADKYEFIKSNDGRLHFKLNIIKGSFTPPNDTTIEKSLDVIPERRVTRQGNIIKGKTDYSVPASVTRAVNGIVQIAKDFSNKRKK